MTATEGKTTPPVITPILPPLFRLMAVNFWKELNVNMTVETAITSVPRAVSLALHPTSVTWNELSSHTCLLLRTHAQLCLLHTVGLPLLSACPSFSLAQSQNQTQHRTFNQMFMSAQGIAVGFSAGLSTAFWSNLLQGNNNTYPPLSYLLLLTQHLCLYSMHCPYSPVLHNTKTSSLFPVLISIYLQYLSVYMCVYQQLADLYTMQNFMLSLPLGLFMSLCCSRKQEHLHKANSRRACKVDGCKVQSANHIWHPGK